MNKPTTPKTVKRRAALHAWHQQLTAHVVKWRSALPSAIIGVGHDTSFLVPSLRGDNPRRSRLPQDDAEWRKLGWSIETLAGISVRSRYPANKRRSRLKQASLNLADFIANTPTTILASAHLLKSVIAEVTDGLRRHSDPCTLQTRDQVQRLCDIADRLAASQAAPPIEQAILNFARTPAMKAILIYAMEQDVGSPLHIDDLRGAVARAGDPSTKRTIENLLRVAETECQSCRNGTCHSKHFALITRPTGRTRTHYLLSELGRRCAEALLEEDYWRSMS